MLREFIESLRMKLLQLMITGAEWNLLDAKAIRIAALETEVTDLKEVLEDTHRLVRMIDVIMNGEDGAAKQASLCDLVGPIRELVARVKEQE